MHRDIGDFLLEIVQNSVEADSSRIDVLLREGETEVLVSVSDNGKGMTADELKRLEDPYFTDGKKHTRRSAGMGIPFLLQTLEMTGGVFNVESEPEKGTTVSFSFPLNHIDTPPLGTISEVFGTVLTMNADYELSIRREKNPGGSYSILRSELKEALGELESGDSQILLRTYLESCESELS